MFIAGASLYARIEREALAVNAAESYSLVLNEMHEYYSDEIVPRAIRAGLVMAHDFRDHANAIPFPATFINDFGARLNRKVQDLSVRLYSEHPFPWSENRILTAEQQETIDFLRQNPDQPYLRKARTENGEVVHLARALTMQQSCVDCHNSYDVTQPARWSVGDFRGVREMSIPLSRGPSTNPTVYVLAAGLALLAAAFGALVVWPTVTRLNQALAESEALTRTLEHMATHDPLTGLPSLRLGCDRLEQTIARCRRSGDRAGVLFVDLDGFKAVNDQHGHEAGDTVLKEAARRMLGAVREVDTVARIGGDEFIVILNNVVDADQAAHAAERIVAAVSQPMEISGGQAKVGASVGIALHPDDGDTADALLRHSDASMYAVKKSGKNSFLRLDPAKA